MSYDEIGRPGHGGAGGGVGGLRFNGGGGYGESGFDQREYGGGGPAGANYYDQTQQYNDEPPRRHGGSDEFSGAAQHASSHAGDSGDTDLFSTALGFLSGNKSKIQEEDVDEDDAVQQHKKFYGDGEAHQQASSNNVGAAAAMQALKIFTGGSGHEAQSGAGQSKFIGLAMAQAAKLFDQQASEGKTVS